MDAVTMVGERREDVTLVVDTKLVIRFYYYHRCIKRIANWFISECKMCHLPQVFVRSRRFWCSQVLYHGVLLLPHEA
jgi:hypothetical protein